MYSFTSASSVFGLVGSRLPNSLSRIWILATSAMGFVASGLCLSNLRKNNDVLANEILSGDHDAPMVGLCGIAPG